MTRVVEDIQKAKDAWEKKSARGESRPAATKSSFPGAVSLKSVMHTPADLEGWDPERELGQPGQFPYTRGVYETMYRGRPWTMRMFAGFGTAKQTNKRFHYLLEKGQTGLSVAFDMPTLMGYDSDHARSRGEVGREGVAICTLQNMENLFDKIPLDQVSTSMTINSTAAIMLAFYLAVAEEQDRKSVV